MNNEKGRRVTEQERIDWRRRFNARWASAEGVDQ